MTAMISRLATETPMPDVVAPDAPNSRSATVPAPPKTDSPSGPTSPAAILLATPGSRPPQGPTSTGGRPRIDAHAVDAAGSNVPDPAASHGAEPQVLSLLDPALCLAADILDDIERVRIANENRLRQLTRSGEDADGEERGFGLDETHPDVARLAAMVETLKKVEHDAALNLGRKMRKHPLGIWAKAQKGIGEKQGARLLAAIGDPYINSAKGQPRTVSALWAYSGLHVLPGGQGPLADQDTTAAGDQHRDTDHRVGDDHSWLVGVAAKRRKGERANWSSKAKMRAYLIAESCIKQLSPDCRDGHAASDAHTQGAVPACACSPYRVTYDARRAHTAVTHPEWTDGHSHNDGLRVASKAILRDLWRAARDWHLANGATA
jgi:hypothetical protein